MVIILCIVFFLSGASSLIFESLWFRLAGLVFGNSVWAASIVLAAFMGGLALGNWLVAYNGDRIKKPVRFYAFLEIVVACSGVALVMIFPSLIQFFVPTFRILSGSPALINVIRAGSSFFLMLIPTTAMGATLPEFCWASFVLSAGPG